MKYTLLLLFVFTVSFTPPPASVFICGSTGAKKYHLKENCRGLSSCRSEIVKTSLKQAQGLGLTLCGWED
ncbi:MULTISPECIES: hypothetical protein [Flavobacterium]|jgi:hypothetical protein|uniref:Uncharacterized protein n=1 Tax=Flavobacterium johnsoniae (strain ATCC 17061 / DSM 2064 / JCM 8514 / BCRC 14874 / CCUG 350202 / NBRC 14942 / NCIMB 11054 / UW101) TaxID=376686 RepID=A5FAB9_FLAJ1|nr:MULTISPECIES: hypothetical protein [Flavobacterium]ABQ07855.1 hypothetical protein Fjoh_4856 [Flavobacterium johnsoniae UW101]OXG01936.1 hypothetical protein B0A63_04560 [Flavobacterium johnsoniae UW101]WDF58600.1 hypothetical protein PQ462_17955 [Flavobacterium sp. KACC 22758]WQG80301.1 hypothetical protein SR927_20045 [Flavobacterium johnsoniae UW101]SHK99757.1 hypothetical protein SAMN05444146_2608 [Flavobacterium johnsoniae]